MLLYICFGVSQVKAQTQNIWVVLGNYLQNIGELPKDANLYPMMQEDKIIFSYYIFNKNDLIKDPYYNISSMDILTSYRFGTLGPHAHFHLMFAKSGKREIIKMNNSLLTVMDQGITVCKQLDLATEDCYEVFQEILSEYKLNDKRKSGIPIITISK